jgi:hypothetical protein
MPSILAAHARGGHKTISAELFTTAEIELEEVGLAAGKMVEEAG